MKQGFNANHDNALIDTCRNLVRCFAKTLT